MPKYIWYTLISLIFLSLLSFSEPADASRKKSKTAWRKTHSAPKVLNDSSAFSQNPQEHFSQKFPGTTDLAYLQFVFFEALKDVDVDGQPLKKGQKLVGLRGGEIKFTKGKSAWTPDRKWLIPPIYQIITQRDFSEMYGLKHTGEGTLYNLVTGESSPTPIKAIRWVYQDYRKSIGQRLYQMGDNPEELSILDKDRKTVLYTLKNPDEPRSQDQLMVPPILAFPQGGYAARFKTNEGVFFQFIGAGANKIGEPIPADEIRVMLRYGQEANKKIPWYFVFFRKVAPDLYWYIDETGEFFKKPEDAVGMVPVSSKEMFLADGAQDELWNYNWAATSIQWKDKAGKRFSFVTRPMITDEQADFAAKAPRWSHYELLATNVASYTRSDRRRVIAFRENPDSKIQLLSTWRDELVTPDTFSTVADAEKFLSSYRDQQDKVAHEKATEVRQQEMQHKALEEAKRRRAVADQEAFIRHIETNGPNPNSSREYDYDVEVYCRYGGKRCEEFRGKSRAMLKNKNQNAQKAQIQRAWDNRSSNQKEGSGSVFTYTEDTTKRHDDAVRRAKDKDDMDKFKQNLDKKIQGE